MRVWSLCCLQEYAGDVDPERVVVCNGGMEAAARTERAACSSAMLWLKFFVQQRNDIEQILEP